MERLMPRIETKSDALETVLSQALRDGAIAPLAAQRLLPTPDALALDEPNRQHLASVAQLELSPATQLLPPALRHSSDFVDGEEVTFYDASLANWCRGSVIGTSIYSDDYLEISHTGATTVLTLVGSQHLLLWREADQMRLRQRSPKYPRATLAYHLLRLHTYLAPETSRFDVVAFENHFNKRRTEQN